MRVALRRGEEPFVAGEPIGAVGRALRARGIGAHVRAALFLGHAHADQAAALVFDGDVARIVFARDEPRHPSRASPGSRRMAAIAP